MTKAVNNFEGNTNKASSPEIVSCHMSVSVAVASLNFRPMVEPCCFHALITKDHSDFGEHSKYPPYVFTEHGILMLSNILKSQRAIAVSIQIIDIFVKLRETLAGQTDIWLEIERTKSALTKQDGKIDLLFKYLDVLIQQHHEPKPRQRIGYKPDKFE